MILCESKMDIWLSMAGKMVKAKNQIILNFKIRLPGSQQAIYFFLETGMTDGAFLFRLSQVEHAHSEELLWTLCLEKTWYIKGSGNSLKFHLSYIEVGMGNSMLIWPSGGLAQKLCSQ